MAAKRSLENIEMKKMKRGYQPREEAEERLAKRISM